LIVEDAFERGVVASPIVAVCVAASVAVDCTPPRLVDDAWERVWPFDDDGVGAWDRVCAWVSDLILEAAAYGVVVEDTALVVAGDADTAWAAVAVPESVPDGDPVRLSVLVTVGDPVVASDKDALAVLLAEGVSVDESLLEVVDEGVERPLEV